MRPTLAELYPGYDLDCPGIKAPIEPGVQPVCDVLNAIPDVHTLWSCEGHPEVPSRPYVTFIGPQDFAFRLSQLLERGNGLGYAWALRATFRSDASLQYTVEPNDFRILGRGYRWWSRLQWSPQVMRKELELLAGLIRRA